MYAVILAAVDGSARSRGVLDAALAIAERFDGRVHLFQSVAVPPEFPAAAHMPAMTPSSQLGREIVPTV